MTPGDSWLNRDDEQPILPGALPGQPGDAAWGAEEKLHQDAGKLPNFRVVLQYFRVEYSTEQ